MNPDWVTVTAATVLGAGLALLYARVRSWLDRHNAGQEAVARSRFVLKGKMAEQFAPMLPGFDYLPADARFLGDPVDYIVFNGYSEAKDGHDSSRLEIVILDVKTGQARLSSSQKAIAHAVQEGQVRFEVVRVDSATGKVTRRST